MRRLALALAVAGLLTLRGAAGAAVDPFYAGLLRDGIAAAERGAHAEAAEILRVACFGMLDDEPQLAACLVRLALAQAGAGDREGFAVTFGRLIEGEELVKLYSAAGLPEELTRPFEARVAEWIPRATLQASPGFSRLAAGQDEAELVALTPRARRARLQQLMSEEPAQARWPLLLARLEREAGEPRAAHAAAERALALAPGSREARCLRGWASLEDGRPAEALPDLSGCAAAHPGFARDELGAHVRLEQWSEARALVESLSEEQRREPGVAALVRRVQQQAGRAAARAPEPAPATSTAPEPQPAPEATAPPAPPALTAGDEARLAEVLAAGGRAVSSDEVLTAYGAASELAARYPDERRVQHAAAELAYRASRYADAVRHFRRGGDPGEDQPLLTFYLAVALWETGDRAAAADAMRRCVGKLRPTPFFESYRQRILGDGAGAAS